MSIKETLISAVIGIVIIASVIACCVTDHQIDLYETTAEVTGIHYEGRHHNDPKMRIRGENFSATLDISDTQAARYIEGDLIVVEVEIREGVGGQYQQYTIIE